MAEQKSGIGPKQLVILVAIGFLVPIIALSLLTRWISSVSENQPDPATMTDQAVAARIEPVGEVAVGPYMAPGARTGEIVYADNCISCHQQGLAGAPKIGDKSAWQTRIASGLATLKKHAIEGLGGMPARGGDPSLADDEVMRAVIYMANASGANFIAPKPTTPIAGSPEKTPTIQTTPVPAPANNGSSDSAAPAKS